jgi:hypothetical protein
MSALDEIKQAAKIYFDLKSQGLSENDAQIIALDNINLDLKGKLDSFSYAELLSCVDELDGLGLPSFLLEEIKNIIENLVEEKLELQSSFTTMETLSPHSMVSSIEISDSEDSHIDFREREEELLARKRKILEEIKELGILGILDDALDSIKIARDGKRGEYNDTVISTLLTREFINDPRVIVNGPLTVDTRGKEHKSQLEEALNNILNGDILLQPILIQEGSVSHWVSAVITKNNGQTDIFIADSMFNPTYPDGSKAVHPLVANLQSMIPTIEGYEAGVRLHNLGLYQQNNDKDCGAWLIDNSIVIASFMQRNDPSVMSTKDLSEAVKLLNDTEETNSVKRMKTGGELGIKLRAIHCALFNSVLGNDTGLEINQYIAQLEPYRGVGSSSGGSVRVRAGAGAADIEMVHEKMSPHELYNLKQSGFKPISTPTNGHKLGRGRSGL